MTVVLTLDAVGLRAAGHLVILLFGIGFLYAGIHFSTRLVYQINMSLEFNVDGSRKSQQVKDEDKAMRDTMIKILKDLVPIVICGLSCVTATLLILVGVRGIPCREFMYAALLHLAEIALLMLFSNTAFRIKLNEVNAQLPLNKGGNTRRSKPSVMKTKSNTPTKTTFAATRGTSTIVTGQPSMVRDSVLDMAPDGKSKVAPSMLPGE